MPCPLRAAAAKHHVRRATWPSARQPLRCPTVRHNAARAKKVSRTACCFRSAKCWLQLRNCFFVGRAPNMGYTICMSKSFWRDVLLISPEAAFWPKTTRCAPPGIIPAQLAFEKPRNDFHGKLSQHSPLSRRLWHFGLCWRLLKIGAQRRPHKVGVPTF